VRSFLDIQKPEFTVVDEKTDAVLLPIAQQAAAERAARTLEQGVRLTGSLAELHGHCYGFEEERAKFEAPLLAVHSSAEARPGYNSMSACEYLDTPETLSAKARCLARLVAAAATPVYYCGAGLSTAAGISDYASQVTRGSSLAGTGDTGALPAGLAAQLQAGTLLASTLHPYCQHRLILCVHCCRRREIARRRRAGTWHALEAPRCVASMHNAAHVVTGTARRCARSRRSRTACLRRWRGQGTCTASCSRTTTGCRKRRGCPSSSSTRSTAPRRTAPHRTAPHRTAPHRTAPHRTTLHKTTL
jgi:hypothetical protein